MHHIHTVNSGRRTWRVVGALAATLSLGLAACGGDDDSEPPADDTETTEAATPDDDTETTEPAPDDAETTEVESPDDDTETTEAATPDDGGEPTAEQALVAGDPAAVYAQGVAGTFSQPPGEGPEAQQDKVVWVLSCGESSMACSVPSAALMEAGETIGWDMTRFDTERNPANYTTGIQQAIAVGADAIIGQGLDCNIAPAALRDAVDNGLEVMGFFSYDCDDPVVDAGDPVMTTQVVYHGFDDLADVMEGWGAAKAAWIAEQTADARVINVTVPTFAVLYYENIGFTAQMEECSTCEIVAELEIALSDLVDGSAGQKLAATIQQNPDANAIKLPNDSLVLAFGTSVVQESGKDLLLVGGECFEPNLDLIRAGTQQACVALPQEWNAWATVDALNRRFADPDTEPVDSGVGFQIVDADTNLPAEGPWTPGFDFRQSYLETWGVG